MRDNTEHYADCPAVCEWEDIAYRFERNHLRCPNNHADHDCTCDDIARSRGEQEAEAAAEHLEEIGLDATGAAL